MNKTANASILPVLSLVLLGVAAEVAFVAMVRLGDLRLVFAELVALWVGVGLILVTAMRVVIPGSARRKLLLWVIVVFAVVFRITMLFSIPSLSDDVYRYLWEGRLVLEGRNPFVLPPSAPEHADLRDEYHGLINHPEMTAVYPPLAQLLFAGSQLLGRGPWTMQLLAGLADLALIGVLCRLLLLRGRDPCWVVIYAWHPLPVVEFAGNAHLDVFAIALMLGALLLLELRRGWTAALLLTLSGLTKLFAYALVPACARRSGWRPLLLVGGLLSLAAVLPFAAAGAGLLRSAGRYAGAWRFNGSVYDLLEWVSASPGGARMLVVAIFVLVAVLLPRRLDDPLRMGFVLAGLFVLLSPTVHPWYVAWVLPFLCLWPRLSWLYLSVAVVFAYQVLGAYAVDGSWSEVAWVRVVQYLPFAILLLAETVVARRLPWYREAERR